MNELCCVVALQGFSVLRSPSDKLLTFNKWRHTIPIETWGASFLESRHFKFNWLASSKNSSVAIYAVRYWWQALCTLKCLLLKRVSVWSRIREVQGEQKKCRKCERELQFNCLTCSSETNSIFSLLFVWCSHFLVPPPDPPFNGSFLFPELILYQEKFSKICWKTTLRHKFKKFVILFSS
jgi:hypothetical protein